MTKIKASQVDSFVKNPDRNIRCILVYGPDQGLVLERTVNLCEKLAGDGEAEIMRFDADMIASETGRLADEAYAISMFGSSRVLRISGTTRKNLIKSIEPLFENPPPECHLVVEAGDLKPDSAIRKQFEKQSTAIALPCYADTVRDLNLLISEEITAQGFSLDDDARTTLIALLGDNRATSRGELQKLALFAHGSEKITTEQISALLGDVSAIANDDIIDDACMGRTDFLKGKLDRLIATSTAPDMLVWAALRHFQLLHKLKAESETKRTSPATLIAKIRPPIHFSRKDKIAAMVQKWPLSKLEIVLSRLNKTFYEARSNPALAPSLVATTFLAISLQARQS